MKGFIKYFISRKVTTLMIYAGIAVAGMISFSRIPTALMPSCEKNGLTVSVKYPGQSPWRIERIITRPIEEAISSVGGISSVLSSSREGEAKIYVAFDDNIDMKYKTLELREMIDQARAYFPRDAEEPEIFGYSSDDKPVMILSLKSESLDVNSLRETAEKRLKKLFERAEGVSEIIITGGVKREIEVAVMQDRLLCHGIGFGKIIETVQKNNVVIPAGSMGEGKEYSIIIDGKYKSIDEIKNTPLFSSKQGSVITLGDAAQIRDYAGKKEDISRVNGVPNVSLYIMKTGTANCIELSRQVKGIASEYKNKDFEINIAYDQAEYINEALFNLGLNCCLGILFAAIVLFVFFRSSRETFPVMLAIPFSLIPVFIYFYLKGMTLNVISLSGLAIAAGMTVDNGIVVLENINMFRKKYRDRDFGLYVNAASQMSPAILASTLTTISIFIPLILFSGSTKNMYGDMAGAVITALASSFFIALTLIPLASMILGNEKKKYPDKNVSTLRNYLTGKALRIYRRSGLAKITDIMLKIYKRLPSYERVMEYAFGNPRMLLASLVCMFFFIMFFSTFLRRELVNPLGRNEIYASVDLDSGTCLEETSRIAGIIEGRIKDTGNVKEVSSRIERWHADLIITLMEDADKKEALKILREKTGDIKEASIFFQEERASESSGELDIEISGPEIEKIRELARDLASRIVRMKGVDDVVLRFKEGRPELDIVVDSLKAGESGITSGEVGDFVRSAVFGPVASKYIDAGEVDIRSRLFNNEADFFYRLPYLQVLSASGSAVPLGELSDFRETRGITSIWRKNRTRMETITVKPGSAGMERLTGMINRELELMDIPPDYHADFGDSYKRLKSNQREMIMGILLAVLLVFMVIASVFESLRLPLVIIVSVPLAVMGSLLTLIIFRISLSMPVYMGMIILAGIAVNNAIVLTDTIHKERQIPGGPGWIIEAAKSRIRPVMMTTITTVLGLLPLLFGGQGSSLWKGFALTVISGLLFSTATVMIAVPVIYSLFKRV